MSDIKFVYYESYRSVRQFTRDRLLTKKQILIAPEICQIFGEHIKCWIWKQLITARQMNIEHISIEVKRQNGNRYSRLTYSTVPRCSSCFMKFIEVRQSHNVKLVNNLALSTKIDVVDSITRAYFHASWRKWKQENGLQTDFMENLCDLDSKTVHV